MRRFDEVDVGRVRTFRAHLAARVGKYGRPLAPKTILEYHRAILCFLRWARREGYAVDPRILELTAPRVPDKEPTVNHIAQIKKILAACNPAVPTEDLVSGSSSVQVSAGRSSAAWQWSVRMVCRTS